MSTSLRAQKENIEAVTDPFARNVLRTSYHVRNHALLYAAGALGILALSLFPTIAGSNGGSGLPGSQSGQTSRRANATNGPGSGASNGAASTSTTAPLTTGAAPLSTAAAPVGSAVGGASSAASGGAASTAVQTGTGTTVGGFACKPGVRQIAFSAYADPCVAAWNGNNGGATYNGVTASTITLAIRHTSDSQGANAATLNAESEAAGGATDAQDETYIRSLVGYFNKVFELYGRHVNVVDFNGQGNYTDEELGQAQSTACADADALSSTVHSFAVLDYEIFGFETQPFAACAARYGMYIPEGAAYFPETGAAGDDYQSWNPYVWATTMNCNLIAQEMAEFVGKQLAPYPAAWAGMDGIVNMKGAQRKFATYVPNNAGYQGCAAQAKQIEESKYGVSSSRQDQYNYALDVSTFPQDAQQAIIQFSADHDTSVVLACDPISTIFLTQDAVQQDYYPEWVLEGVALTDTDNYAQLWDPQAIEGHLFGLSQAGGTAALLSPSGEAGRVLSSIGVPINYSSVVEYYLVLSMFNQLQAAGPDLTPQHIAAGTAKLPAAGGATGADGTWYFGNTHTAIIDSREIYWNGSQTSQANGKMGTYIAVYAGQRYGVGRYPSGQPPFYP